MRRILFILLLAGNLEAKEYTFDCITDSKVRTSLLIDTDKKLLLFGRAKYNNDWKETETTIEARCNFKDNCLTIASFNKITGDLNIIEYSRSLLEFRCKSVKRLIP